MIINLFSVFDPATGFMSLNWLRITLIFIFPLTFWNTPRKIIIILSLLTKKLINEIITHTNKIESSIMFVRIFLYILINNIIGLLPYVFTSSAHLVFSISMALTIWLSLIIFGWINKTNNIFTHLVPIGTPYVLIPFIVLIESIRNIIRPGSLAVRLRANIIAGHLLIRLLGNNLVRNFPFILIIIWIFLGLFIFELAVALIQSYVFITLSTLYSREI